MVTTSQIVIILVGDSAEGVAPDSVLRIINYGCGVWMGFAWPGTNPNSPTLVSSVSIPASPNLGEFRRPGAHPEPTW